MYKDKANMSLSVVQNMVMAFYSPSLLSREKVENMYDNFLSRYQNEEAFPLDWTRCMTNKEKLPERRDRILGTKRKYQFHVVRLMQDKKLNPNREGEKHKQKPSPNVIKTRKIMGMVQITRLIITLQAYSSRVLETLNWKLTVRGTEDFTQLYPICLTDKDFEESDD